MSRLSNQSLLPLLSLPVQRLMTQEEIKQNIYKKTAIHRFATVEEIVDAYRFCVDNSFVNGSLIEVNGGYSYK